MHARVVRSHLSPAPIERLTDEIARREVPRVASADGFLAGAWLVDLDAEEAVTLVLVEAEAGGPVLPEPVERWEVLSFAGRLGGEWCLVHDLTGDALPSVLESAVDRATATAGSVGAVGLVDAEGRRGVCYAFLEDRPAAGHGGRLYRVLASA